MSHVLEIEKRSTEPTREAMELWGGVEYTCNRVDDRYFDQTELSGHDRRLGDYERFVGLGIRTLRFGLLWERYAREGSWRWFDERLECLQQLGIRPIAGLLHHGSGPPHTSLLDPAFPEKLAAYAGAVAQRYPWIDAYTPVNEPNTTARFSGMYGVWYPHHQSSMSYLRALLNELKGTVLSMEAIRRVRPDAQLIQTDDVGRICGTPELRNVSEMLDLRRWLPYDLLCGSVDKHHPLFEYIHAVGIAQSDIMWFADHPCPPSVIGVNYYVTSDRYLDHRVDLYPEGLSSAEGPFVDVEAVRVSRDGLTGVGALLTEAWERYQIPVAITEVHLGCSIDEQIRWMVESWKGAMQARRQGVECVALTAWALLGSYYWNQLVTKENGYYESGVFDVRNGEPVITELAQIVSQIAKGHVPQHPALAHPGWWRQSSRLCYPLRQERAA